MMDQNHHTNKTEEEQPSGKRKTRCCDGFKVFLVALSFSFIAKTLSGVLMKTSITQIERRFDITSSVAGLIDGSFEIGNLLVIVFVSYFGSKLPRPKVIGVGCIIMGTGSILTALPHFFMGYYKYSKETNVLVSENSTSSLSVCLINQNALLNRTSPAIMEKGCVKESGSYLWIYVLMGNMLRGIGESPIVPLGISYIDDFATEGHSSFYLGILNTVTMIGPIMAFLLGSLFTSMYVDIGYVDLSSIRITPKDSTWVGAWWLGSLVSGLVSITSSLPFFFLSANNKPQEERKLSISLHGPKTNEERKQTAKLTSHEQNVTENMTGFFQSLKTILTNTLYVMYLFLTLLHISSFIGSFTYIFKYVEQQFGRSISEANFLLGIIALPILAIGIFTGGYIIKKFKLSLLGSAKLGFYSMVIGSLLQLSDFAMICEKSVAGLTLTYDGNNPVESHINVPLSYCNSDCNCDESQWEPICGDNGITYISPCLAGCKSLSGNKKSTVFHNCKCVEVTGSQNRNNSARFGECPRSDHCTTKFNIFLTLQALQSFAFAIGSVSNMMLVFKNVPPELKSLAVGFHSLTIRSLGGVLAPVYFGALIDRVCMKWSINSCGKKGACRIYNSILFGYTFLGLRIGLRVPALVLYAIFIFVMKKKYENKDMKAPENEGKVLDEATLEPLNYRHIEPSAGADSELCT
ncbi:solute carrier organic anion transporter family member 1B3-like [Tamandua tetradactyla]|uniref:solute carrier organic anion transporter family member 1B3-like n=1 Tax=Tamandua tetradactyla TaxID=48850 RepID=UPI004053DF19